MRKILLIATVLLSLMLSGCGLLDGNQKASVNASMETVIGKNNKKEYHIDDVKGTGVKGDFKLQYDDDGKLLNANVTVEDKITKSKYYIRINGSKKGVIGSYNIEWGEFAARMAEQARCAASGNFTEEQEDGYMLYNCYYLNINQKGLEYVLFMNNKKWCELKFRDHGISCMYDFEIDDETDHPVVYVYRPKLLFSDKVKD